MAIHTSAYSPIVLGGSITKVRGTAGVQSEQPTRARAGRLIATCRVVLAGFAAMALFIDPDLAGQSTRIRLAAVPLILYALALLAVSWHVRAPTRRFLVIVHILDCVLYTAMVFLTRGAAAPFLVFFFFLVFCAMLRFGTRAVVGTGIGAAAAYLVLAVSEQTLRNDPGYLLLLVSAVGVVTTLIAYVSAHQERSLRDMRQVAGWPAIVMPTGQPVRDALARAAALLRAPRAVAVWEAGEEPWVHIATLDGADFSIANEGPEAAEAIVAPPLRAASFFVVNRERDVVVVDDANVVSHWRGDPLGDALRGRFQPHSILSAPLGGEVVRGRFFAFDSVEETTIDDLVLARVAAGLIAAQLAQIHFIDGLRAGAVAGERIRLARNLHDWLLQSLTGASLQIEAARRALGAGHPADERLVKIQELLETDQRELRVFISQLRPMGGSGDATPPLHSRLASLAERFERQWHVEVDVAVAPPAPVIPDGLASEIYSLVNEAVANAAKHAGAHRIIARVEIDPDDVVMSIDDDGRGFPFIGIFPLEELDEQKRGPVTLKERVASLGGSLVLYSTEEGARIEIRIPRQT